MAVGSFMLTANAQVANKSSVVFGTHTVSPDAQAKRNTNIGVTGVVQNIGGVDQVRQKNADRTTTGGGRWFSYLEYMTAFYGSANVGGTLTTMWNDSSAEFNYGGTEDQNHVTSVGANMDPTFPPYYDSTLFSGLNGTIQVTATDDYYVDSVIVFGNYVRPTAATYIDTLTLSIVYGNGYGMGSAGDNLVDYYYYQNTAAGTFPSSYWPGYDTIKWMGIMYDSLGNTAGQASGSTTPVSTTKIQLGINDTFQANDFHAPFHVGATASGVHIPPGDMSGFTCSFHSGGQPGVFPGGLGMVNDASNLYFGYYSPEFFFHADGSGNPLLETYAENAALLPISFGTDIDWEIGYTQFGGSWNDGNVYIPMWEFASAPPNFQQYINYAYHINCPTCTVLGVENVNKNKLNNVKVYPSPADNMMSVSCSFVNPTNVTVSVINMMGQTVATQTMNNFSNGSANFNTSEFANGFYVVDINAADGTHTTSKVAVAH